MAGKWHVTPVNESKHNWPLAARLRPLLRHHPRRRRLLQSGNADRGQRTRRPGGKDYYFTDAIGDNAVRLHRRVRHAASSRSSCTPRLPRRTGRCTPGPTIFANTRIAIATAGTRCARSATNDSSASGLLAKRWDLSARDARCRHGKMRMTASGRRAGCRSTPRWSTAWTRTSARILTQAAGDRPGREHAGAVHVG